MLFAFIQFRESAQNLRNLQIFLVVNVSDPKLVFYSREIMISVDISVI